MSDQDVHDIPDDEGDYEAPWRKDRISDEPEDEALDEWRPGDPGPEGDEGLWLANRQPI